MFMKKLYNLIFLSVILWGLVLNLVYVQAQNLDDFKYSSGEKPGMNILKNENDFNGYTNYWHDTYTNWYRYGNLFKIAAPNVKKTILQSKVDMAEDMNVPGLIMQEGFMNGLIMQKFISLDEPSAVELEEKIKNGNVLVFTDPASEVGKKLLAKVPEEDFTWPEKLNCHQYGSPDIVKVYAFYLNNGDRKLFVVSSKDVNIRKRIKDLIDNTKEVVENYDLWKGWFGAFTLLNSVTCTQGHPLEVMGYGMNEGCSWFVFNGYMDFLSKDDIANWVKEVQLPVVTDVGASCIFGCKDYDGIQIQQMYTQENWIDYARKKGGYVFRNVYDPDADPYHYDGYIATEGNKEQIDNENVPFVLNTGPLENNALSSMVLFIKKGEPLTRESMWKAIMDRREVGVLEKGKMMGPAQYRNPLDMLLLDRIFLEEYFGDRINMEAVTEGYDLQVTLTNTYNHPVSGTLTLTLPQQMKVKANPTETVTLPGGTTKTFHFLLQPTADAMARTNAIAIHFQWNGKEKSILTMLNLPPAISVYRLLYGHAPTVNYPVTIHNFTTKKVFPVKVQVTDAGNEKNVVFTSRQNCNAGQGTFKNMLFKLKVPAGSYKVKVTALGQEYTSQLGVGKAKGKPYVYKTDLNGDGIDEYRMENDSVQITLLATGARVIEYIVKSREDNVLFKLWPEKPIDDKRPFRKKKYYPYGGFEDFLGQASMETHQLYNAEIVKKEGDYVSVKMWTDYYGNRLVKIFTLYGDSPLLEVRFALTFKNPEANMIGPQPMLALGEKHWTEDVFYVPEKTGIHEFRMKPERYYGQAFFLKEGWNAGYDTKEDITFVGAFPVDQPLFLHMWQNHPSNEGSHYYYAEFQPWVPIYQKSTMYFTYYLWGAGGPWENGVRWLRERNLITTIDEDR